MSKRATRRLRRTLQVGASPVAILALVGSPVVHAHAETSSGGVASPSPTSPDGVAALQQQRIVALSDSSGLTSAALWRGRLLDPSGVPTSGTVVAYIRPSGARVAATASASPDEALVPIARTTAGADGSFVLRADYDAALAPLLEKNGSATLMLVANTSGAIAFQLKTVWWSQPTGTAGAWVENDPAASVPARSSAVSALLNPSDIKLQSTTVATAAALKRVGRVLSPVRTASLAPPGNCIFWSGGTGPDSKAYIGATFLQKSSYWQARFGYTQTNTSSFQVGWSAAAGGGGASFTAAGSETTSSTNTAAGISNVNSTSGSATGRKHWITVHTALNQWRCWNSPTTPPNPAFWPLYYTLEGGAWARDFATDGVPIPACDTNNANNQFHLGGTSSIARDTGSSTSISNSLSGSISGQGGPISFNFGVNVQNDSSLSHLINSAWANTATGNKLLCGIEGPVLSGDTRVVAIGLGT